MDRWGEYLLLCWFNQRICWPNKISNLEPPKPPSCFCLFIIFSRRPCLRKNLTSNLVVLYCISLRFQVLDDLSVRWHVYLSGSGRSRAVLDRLLQQCPKSVDLRLLQSWFSRRLQGHPEERSAVLLSMLENYPDFSVRVAKRKGQDDDDDEEQSRRNYNTDDHRVVNVIDSRNIGGCRNFRSIADNGTREFDIAGQK